MMTRDNHLHHYGDYAITNWRLNLKLSISILLISVLLPLLLVGCGRIANTFVMKGEYKAPALPKTELATIQVNTAGGWLRRLNQFALRIDGRLALDEKIDVDEDITIKEILVSPGQHNMSVRIIYRSFDDVIPQPHQIVTGFSADVEAGGSYLLRGEFSPSVGGELSFKSWLADTNTGKDVSKKNILERMKFKVEE
ncbi:hypothetical protein F4X33_04545 [Candidatus Poribacteria bacterium]|nr:hypothetical protein [Candidatus Poribacteria bacterium]